MKKITLVTIASFVFLFLSSLTAYFIKYAPIDDDWVYIAVALGLLTFSALLALIAKKVYCINYICFILSSISLGFGIRTWYIIREFDNPLWVMLLVSLVTVIYLWLFYALTFIPFFGKHIVVTILLFMILSLVGYLLIVFNTKTTYVSTFGYYAIVELAFIFALCKETESIKVTFRNIVLSTYSVFVVLLIIIIFILLGEGGDFDFDFSLGDFDLGVGSKKKNKKIKE